MAVKMDTEAIPCNVITAHTPQAEARVARDKFSVVASYCRSRKNMTGRTWSRTTALQTNICSL